MGYTDPLVSVTFPNRTTIQSEEVDEWVSGRENVCVCVECKHKTSCVQTFISLFDYPESVYHPSLCMSLSFPLLSLYTQAY